MSRVFCTLKEAAATLHASEDQIQALLERGLLREFREGPCRLVKEADVSVLAAVGEHRTRRADSSAFRATGPAPAPGSRRTETGSSRTMGQARRTEGRRPQIDNREPQTKNGRQRNASASALREAPGLSVRQWFWMGLIQDRPLVIALLSSLILLGLSALAAGLCFVAESF